MAKEKLTKQDAPEEHAEPKKKSPLMKYLIIVGILLAQTAAAYFIQKTIFFPGPPSLNEQGEAASEHGDKGEESDRHGGGNGDKATGTHVALLDEIIVNPAGTGGRRFLSTIVGLTLKDAKAEAALVERMPIVRDAAITLLASKSLSQLASVEYRDSLKIELKTSVNSLVPDMPVTSVVFSTYVLQ